MSKVKLDKDFEGKSVLKVEVPEWSRRDERSAITAQLSWETVADIVHEYELFYVIEDLILYLEDEDINGEPFYDKEKYTPEILRELAEKVLEHKENCGAISDSYNEICQYVLDRFDIEEE
jgi:hypothetical protein